MTAVVKLVVELEGAAIDLTGLRILPGLINAHDHLQFSVFPRLGAGPYPSATAWARDIYHPAAEPSRSLLQIPKRDRLLWGGLRNLAAGVTTVHHHDPWDPIFEEDFPVRVVKCGWAHSLEFSPDVAKRFAATPPDSPFVIHLAEGTDAAAEQEVFQLHQAGALDHRTVLVHGVGLSRRGWDLVAQTGASVVWCPRSNVFTLGRTLDIQDVPRGVRLALGSDSPLTAPGDLLDDITYVKEQYHLADSVIQDLTGDSAVHVFRLPQRPGDWIATTALGEPPKLVVRDGRILLISPELASVLPSTLRAKFSQLDSSPLHREGRPPVLVRWNVEAISHTASSSSLHSCLRYSSA